MVFCEFAAGDTKCKLEILFNVPARVEQVANASDAHRSVCACFGVKVGVGVEVGRWRLKLERFLADGLVALGVTAMLGLVHVFCVYRHVVIVGFIVHIVLEFVSV
jgi:hypothetical protein